MTARDTPDLVRDDGTLWKASYRDAGYAMAALINKNVPQFYFRELAENPRKTWWRFWEPKYIRTGKIWEGFSPISDSGFKVIK